MGGAFFWGFVGASSLIIGGVLAMVFKIRPRLLGLVMAFGGGVLVSAVAYELVLDAFTLTGGRSRAVAFGLLAGALTFYGGDAYIDRMGGAERKRMRQASQGSALAIVLGIVLDGIPESVVLGLSLIDGDGIGVAVLTAVFLSNLPEAVAATTGLLGGGWRRRNILWLWVGVAVVSGLSALAGFALFDSASPEAVAFVQAFAGGAILTMLADTMFPEAYEHGGKQVGLLTTFGFFVAFSISTLE
jgi:zinc transporter, ZIP family